MTDDCIKDRIVVAVMEVLQRDREEITDDADFENDLGADSLDKAELMMRIEEEFDTEIPDTR